MGDVVDLKTKVVDVDLDLDVLAPPTRKVRFRGEVHELPGTVPIPTVMQSLRLRRELALYELRAAVLADAVGEGEPTDEQAAELETISEKQEEAMGSMYGLVMDLFRDVRPDVPDLRFSMDQLVFVMGLAISGADKTELEDAVKNALDASEAPEEDKDLPPTPSPEDEAGSSRSAKPSRRRS